MRDARLDSDSAMWNSSVAVLDYWVDQQFEMVTTRGLKHQLPLEGTSQSANRIFFKILKIAKPTAAMCGTPKLRYSMFCVISSESKSTAYHVISAQSNGKSASSWMQSICDRIPALQRSSAVCVLDKCVERPNLLVLQSPFSSLLLDIARMVKPYPIWLPIYVSDVFLLFSLMLSSSVEWLLIQSGFRRLFVVQASHKVHPSMLGRC